MLSFCKDEIGSASSRGLQSTWASYQSDYGTVSSIKIWLRALVCCAVPCSGATPADTGFPPPGNKNVVKAIRSLLIYTEVSNFI